MKQLKRLFVLMLTGTMVLSMASCSKKDKAEEQKKFDEFIAQEFVETMESDYTSMHVYMQNPEEFGIDTDKVEVNLGTRLDEESQQKAMEEVNASYEEFQEFDRDDLTSEQQDIYDMYEYQASLSDELNDEKFDYYASVFESMSGLHFQLPTLFADWEIRNEQDVKDLILLLEDVKPYVDSALEYTKKQEEKGLLMLDLDSIIQHCDQILEKGTDSSVLSSMQEKVEALKLDESLTKDYQKQLEEAFTSSFLPAYQAMKDTMETFQTSGTNNSEGLAKFENGKEYYELLLQQNIGSTKSVEEIRSMLEDKMEESIIDVQALFLRNEDILQYFVSEDVPETNYESYTEILDDVQSKMGEDFPEVNNLQYHIEDINKELATDSGVAAYFNIPPIDGDSVKQLRVNPNMSDITSISTYTTITHEGFPGHMYQYAYMYENEDNNFVKVCANSNAYTEGYATYAQYESLAYLDSIDQDYLELTKANEIFTYCITLLADISIHYDGLTFEEFMASLEEQGLALGTSEGKELYLQLQANPAAFAPYYVGYFEFLDLKEKAQEELGDKFNNKDFNTAILESGNAPFSVVEKYVDKYIETAKDE